MKQFIFGLLIVLLAYSQSNTSYEFLNHHFGVKSAALSGANMASENSITDLLINPASIPVSVQSFSISLSEYILDTRFGQVAYNYSLSDKQSISFAIIALLSNNFEHRLEDGLLIGDYSVTEFGLITSLVDQQLLDNFSFAITGKLVQSSISEFQSSALMFSLSTLYQPKQFINHRFAVVIDHFGFQLSQYNEETESLPFALRFAYSYKLAKAPIQLMVGLKKLDNKKPLKSVSFGIEVDVHQSTSIRMSYDNEINQSFQLRNERNLFSGFSFGTGIKSDEHQVDISYSIYGFLEIELAYPIRKYLIDSRY